jgi:GNAT superfamily N-acetyltransferase
MKPVMDERIVWFAYYNDSPIGIFINLPDLNQWFKYLNGKFGLLNKIRFLWLKTFRKNNKFTGLAFGVVPEFQGKGVDAYLIAEAAQLLQSDAMPYTKYEMQWIGDFNPKMINIASNLGEVFITRKLTTYRCLFDPSIPFKRHPSL